MTDLPTDRAHASENGQTFRQLMALKAQPQAEKSEALQAWKHWYVALDGE